MGQTKDEKQRGEGEKGRWLYGRGQDPGGSSVETCRRGGLVLEIGRRRRPPLVGRSHAM
jgi:hypothetical protein